MSTISNKELYTLVNNLFEATNNVIGCTVATGSSTPIATGDRVKDLAIAIKTFADNTRAEIVKTTEWKIQEKLNDSTTIADLSNALLCLVSSTSTVTSFEVDKSPNYQE